MTEAYYPRHSELERPEDTETDALQARVHELERLLRDVSDYVAPCSVPECDCVGRRIQLALEVPHGQ